MPISADNSMIQCPDMCKFWELLLYVSKTLPITRFLEVSISTVFRNVLSSRAPHRHRRETENHSYSLAVYQCSLWILHECVGGVPSRAERFKSA